MKQPCPRCFRKPPPAISPDALTALVAELRNRKIKQAFGFTATQGHGISDQARYQTDKTQQYQADYYGGRGNTRDQARLKECRHERYSEDDRWLALQSTTKSGRVLRYLIE